VSDLTQSDDTVVWPGYESTLSPSQQRTTEEPLVTLTGVFRAAGDLAVSCLRDDLPDNNAAVCRASDDSAGNCLRGALNATTHDQRQNVRKKVTLTSCGHAGGSLGTGHESKRLVMSPLTTTGIYLALAAIWMDQMRSNLIRSSLATHSGENPIPSHRRCCR
jgi:hypothetical protein